MAFQSLKSTSDNFACRVFSLLSLVCIGMLAFGQYLQYWVGVMPCPMCIVQRYILFSIAVVAGLTGVVGRKAFVLLGGFLVLVLSLFGVYVSARQSWLQWYPPEVASCGRDFYGMIENFPLQRAIPMIFKGSGDCTKVAWTFLGASIPNWAFLSFSAMAVLSFFLVRGAIRRRQA